MSSIRREGQAANRTLKFMNAPKLSGLGGPQANRPIITAGDQPFAVWTVGDAGHSVRVAIDLECEAVVGNVPNTDGFIHRRSRKPPAGCIESQRSRGSSESRKEAALYQAP